MKRHLQHIDELFTQLTEVEASWEDDFAKQLISSLEKKTDSTALAMKKGFYLYTGDYEIDITLLRLILDKSKDEFTVLLKALFSTLEISPKKLYQTNPELFYDTMNELELDLKLAQISSREYDWKDILIERLKGGRGSAIKGQARGRSLEDFVEHYVEMVFPGNYDVRCSFLGRIDGTQEKADFAIPNKDTPSVLIEVKAFGATGSKQTDVIGDITRIIEKKRHDTTFILFTDGLSWKARANDFRKLVNFQNEGAIYRIYTRKMCKEFEADLEQLKVELGL